MVGFSLVFGVDRLHSSRLGWRYDSGSHLLPVVVRSTVDNGVVPLLGRCSPCKRHSFPPSDLLQPHKFGAFGGLSRGKCLVSGLACSPEDSKVTTEASAVSSSLVSIVVRFISLYMGLLVLLISIDCPRIGRVLLSGYEFGSL